MQNLADQQAGVRAAYYGFIDRYGAVPGDMPRDAARDALGDSAIARGGPGQGRLPAPGGDGWDALNGVWEHLSVAGFISGHYQGAATTAPTSADEAPVNAFQGLVLLAHHDGYLDDDGRTPDRLLYHFGGNVPASVARELDDKLDDGRPGSGTVRNAAPGQQMWESDAACVRPARTGDHTVWDVELDAPDCNPVFLF